MFASAPVPVPYIISVPVSVTVGSRKERGEKKKKRPEWIRTEPQKKGQRENGRLVGT